MPLAAFASAVLLTLASLAQSPAPATSDLRNLRWVRATVRDSSPESVTLQLRDRELVVHRDAATEIVANDPSAALAAGAIVVKIGLAGLAGLVGLVGPVASTQNLCNPPTRPTPDPPD